MPRRNLMAIALVGALSLLCWQTTQGAREKDEVMELYGLFVDAVEQVEQNYVKPVSRRDLIEGALRGMCEVLDQHSSYINTRGWKQFKKQLEGSFGGIGIQVNVDEETGRLKVIAPMVGTPAYEAGVLAGDLIVDVEGKTTEGMTLDQAVEVLQGRPGTPVALKVLHPGAKEPVELKMNRAIIDVPTILADHRNADDKPDYIFNKEDKIGYVRITNFNQRTPEELTKVLDELKAEGMLGLILDLRDNPGGLLSAAVAVSDLFIEEGDIVTTKGRNVEDKSYKATKSGTYTGFPMAVLVNGNSASASEIVSACLQDHKRAVVIGSRSFGKGSVQNIMELEDGESVLKLTVATYWRPSGKNIHRFEDAKETDEWGVSPDPNFEITLSPKEYRDWATARRDRDLLSKANKPVDAEKPLDDKVLAKAVAYIHDEEAKLKGGDPKQEKEKEAEKEPEKKAAE